MFENRAPWADRYFKWVAPLVLIVSAGAGAWYYFGTHRGAPTGKPAPQTPPLKPVPASTLHHPVPAVAPAQAPLPPLNDSDPSLREAFEGLFGAESVAQMLASDDLVRRIVVTIDNLPRQKVAVERRPLKPSPGETQVVGQGDQVTLSETNDARYAPYVKLLQSADLRSLTDMYFRFYPLFQQAYENLGYPGQYFNDRLVEAIDDMLAAPEVPGQIQLVRPKVFYEYADRALESRSAGQKLLVRMGRENEAKVKAKLRELRAIVAARTGH